MCEKRVCVAEPLAFHFSAHVKRLEQPHSPCETHISHKAAASRDLEIQGLTYFLHVTRTVHSRNRENDQKIGLPVAEAPQQTRCLCGHCKCAQSSKAHALLTHPVCPSRQASPHLKLPTLFRHWKWGVDAFNSFGNFIKLATEQVHSLGKVCVP